MLYLLIFLLLILAIGAIWLARLPAAYTIEQSIVIDKPRSTVFVFLKDLRNNAAWSPWLTHDPACKVTIDKPDAIEGFIDWDSAKIGAGRQTLRSATDGARLEYLLEFFRPFKSRADVAFTLADADAGKTLVRWSILAPLPWFIRPFRVWIEFMLTRDFRWGLAMLRGVLEPGADNPRIEFNGQTNVSASTCVALPFAGSFAAMQTAMEQDFPKLLAQVGTERMAGPVAAAYHKVNPLKQTCVMDMVIPVKNLLPHENESKRQLPGGAYYQCTYKGSYEFLGEAWNAAIGHTKMEKFKQDKSRPMLEVYITHPQEVAHNNALVTHLLVPIKT